jgi:hypothetical protein
MPGRALPEALRRWLVCLPAVLVLALRVASRSGGGRVVSERDVPGLIRALRDVCETFAADAASVSYIAPDGLLVELHVTAHGVSWLADEGGHLVLVDPEIGA